MVPRNYGGQRIYGVRSLRFKEFFGEIEGEINGLLCIHRLEGNYFRELILITVNQ